MYVENCHIGFSIRLAYNSTLMYKEKVLSFSDSATAIKYVIYSQHSLFLYLQTSLFHFFSLFFCKAALMIELCGHFIYSFMFISHGWIKICMLRYPEVLNLNPNNMNWHFKKAFDPIVHSVDVESHGQFSKRKKVAKIAVWSKMWMYCIWE